MEFESGLCCLQDEELAILAELSHIQEIVHSLCLLSSDPDSLPESTEHLIDDMLSDGKTRHQLKQVISDVFFTVVIIPITCTVLGTW